MSVEIKDYIPVSTRAKELGFEIPSGIIMLPENFADAPNSSEFRVRSEAATIKSLLRQSEVPYGELYKNGEKRAYIQNNAADLILPLLYVSASLATENQNLVSVALGVISNYVTDYFKGRGGSQTIELSIVVESSRATTCKKIVYNGDAEGLKQIPKIIKQLTDD